MVYKVGSLSFCPVIFALGESVSSSKRIKNEVSSMTIIMTLASSSVSYFSCASHAADRY